MKIINNYGVNYFAAEVIQLQSWYRLIIAGGLFKQFIAIRPDEIIDELDIKNFPFLSKQNITLRMGNFIYDNNLL